MSMEQMDMPYNGTTATGGDPLKENLNVFYDPGDLTWILISTSLVLIMTPGIGFFYAGLARRHSALSLIWIAIMTFALVSFQWFFFGYSITFSHEASFFIGKMNNVGFMNVLAQPSVGSSKIPDLLYALYQCMFATVTAAIVVGAIAERGRMLPCVIFVFIWTTLVYDPIACWTWNPAGWAFKLGNLDFAGGTPVHITSGVAALAYSIALGSRKGYHSGELTNQPHSVSFIVIGTVFLWFGWAGFNGGSALGSNLRAVMAVFVTNLSASIGGITWVLMDYRLERKWSTVGFCSGAVAGLVCITPGSGFVQPWAAVVYGVVSGVACNYATNIKYLLRTDDCLDVFAIHAIGGFAGNILTAFFADRSIAALDGYTMIAGGWIDHHWVQLPYHLAASAAAAAWSFALTLLIAYGIKFAGYYVPALRLRLDENEEERGVDEVEIGEFAYDYVGFDAQVKEEVQEMIPRKTSAGAAVVSIFK